MPIAPTTLTAISLTTTAVQVASADDPSATEFTVQPTNGTIYLGGLSFTAANGLQIVSGQAYTVRTRNPSNWWIRTASGTVDVRVMVGKGDC